MVKLYETSNYSSQLLEKLKKCQVYSSFRDKNNWAAYLAVMELISK